MSDLCCCEYYDIEGERSHLLGVCCNCYHLDESCERLITCKPIPAELRSSLVRAVMDRVRIPWYGGAKQVSLCMPIIYVPALLWLATINATCTIVAATIALLVVWIASKSAMMIPKFFVSWMAISVASIVGVFELLVVPWLLILPEENIVVIGLFVVAFICIVKLHLDVKRIYEGLSSEKNAYYCQFCQVYKNGGTIHKYWVDTCVTSSSTKYYTLATFTCAAGLLYLANLNLTTVCHPFRPFRDYSLLLPDDCGEVYDAYALAFPYVTAVYAVAIGGYLRIILGCMWQRACCCGNGGYVRVQTNV